MPNELISEIFGYLDSYQAFHSFYDLNIRFRNILIPSNHPIRIHISSVSKPAFEYYLTQVILPNTNRIQSFRLSNPFVTDMIVPLRLFMKYMTRLETLVIHNIESYCIESIVHLLVSLPVLSTLIITSINEIKGQNDLYQKIFRLPALKYCQLSVETLEWSKPLSTTKNQLSPIEHLNIKHKVSLDQLDSLLFYTPQLCRLSVNCLKLGDNSPSSSSSLSMSLLTHVSLKTDPVPFDDFELLATKYFRLLRSLRLVVYFSNQYSNITYLNADRWEQLISTHIHNLHIFDFQHQYCTWDNDRNRHSYETQVNKFNSPFWIEHQWFFEHQYYEWMYSDTATFYSINSSR